MSEIEASLVYFYILTLVWFVLFNELRGDDSI